MRTTLTLLALGLAAWISVPASAADETTPGSAYSSDSSTPVDSSSARNQEQEPAAGAPSSDAPPSDAPPATPMGNDNMNTSDDKPASAP